LPEIT